MSSSQHEIECPDCGEMVRKNSLRCWNCGAFMNPELEAKFLEMQSKPAAPILSELPQSEVHTVDDDTDDDFELSIPSISAPAGDDDSSSAIPEFSPGESKPQQDIPSVSHSEATGGDALLDIAMQEERETTVKKKSRKVTGGMKTAGGGIIIFCPYGCHIEVKEQHRGMTGRCPKCQAPFIVPIDPPNYKKKTKAGASEEETGVTSGKFNAWMQDLHLHIVNPEKLKLKADSLLKDFVQADLGFSPDEMLVAVLSKKAGGLFGAKGEDPREALFEHLKEGKPMEELPATEKFLFSKDDLAQLKVVQPTKSRGDSIFAGIPVFGEGRIAVQLPLTEQVADPLYVSFGITEFWDFRKQVEEIYGITGLGEDVGIPPEHVFSTYKCHYTDTLVKGLENLDFYKADPTVELAVAGYRCGACSLVVSEEGRKKENLGGKAGKGIAKAKCPKCGSKMGDNPVYTLKSELVEPDMSGESS